MTVMSDSQVLLPQLRSLFTDADVFGLEVQPLVPVEVRAMLLVAVFLVDFTCFENNRGASLLDDF